MPERDLNPQSQQPMPVAIMQVLRFHCNYAGGTFLYSYVGGSFYCNYADDCFMSEKNELLLKKCLKYFAQCISC